MTNRFSTAEPTEREAGIAAAALAVQRGQLVVLPTDTVYGVGADAFSPDAVKRLLAAKGRGRDMPPPVLVSAATTLDALHGDLDAIAGWQNPDWLDIPIPTLVVTAESDTPAIQDFARQWSAGLPRAPFASIPRAGHMMPIEQPELTTAVITDWLLTEGIT